MPNLYHRQAGNFQPVLLVLQSSCTAVGIHGAAKTATSLYRGQMEMWCDTFISLEDSHANIKPRIAVCSLNFDNFLRKSALSGRLLKMSEVVNDCSTLRPSQGMVSLYPWRTAFTF